jgi:hypothetical protein
MIFLTINKNDIESKQVSQHFPMVMLVEISDPNLIAKIDNNENVYLDWRLKTSDEALLIVQTIRGSYKILENKGNKYLTY